MLGYLSLYLVLGLVSLHYTLLCANMFDIILPVFFNVFNTGVKALAEVTKTHPSLGLGILEGSHVCFVVFLDK